MQNSFHLITSLTGERSPVTSGMIYWAGIKQSSSPGPCSEHIGVRVMLWLSWLLVQCVSVVVVVLKHLCVSEEIS